VALAPLLVALGGGSRLPERRPIGRSFALGLTAGAVYFAGTLYWITRVMAMYGGLQTWVAALVNLALIAYLSLFPAIFAMVMGRLLRTQGPGALGVAPFVWVATELGRTHLFTGFPWVLLGYSQMPVPPIVQLASLGGVFSVSALVAAPAAALAYAALAGPGPARRRYGPLACVFALIGAVAVWGSLRIADGRLTREGDTVRVGLIQGSADQIERENTVQAAGIFDRYLGMSRQAIGQGARLVVWPESAVPFYFESERYSADRIRDLARQSHVSILFGGDQIEWRVEGARQVAGKYFNSAFMVRPDGSTGGSYRKIHLVPFGEYVPLKRLFFFAAPLVQAVSDFSPGDAAVLLPVDGHLMSTAICYEIVYPDLVRRFVTGGSELLSTITNDAWFGATSAPYQHFAQAAMRAVEEGRYLVRAANTGISGIVDPYGRVLQETPLYQPAMIVGDVRFLHAPTVYARIGDVFAYASVVLTAAVLLLGRRVK